MNASLGSLGDTAFAALRERSRGHSLCAVLGTQPLWDLGDTAFQREGTFPHVFLATESLQSSKTCNTAM